jgi:hypothetical protein
VEAERRPLPTIRIAITPEAFEAIAARLRAGGERLQLGSEAVVEGQRSARK